MRPNHPNVRRSVMSYGSALAAVLIPAVLLVPLFVLSPAVCAQSATDAAGAGATAAHDALTVSAASADVVSATTAPIAVAASADPANAPATLKADPLTADIGPNPGQPQTEAQNHNDDSWNGSAPLAADPGQAGDHGDDGVLAGVGMLDDQTLARQRGGAVGMVMVAATPQLMRGGSVTLWDEIAPPTPIPIPVDSQAAQGNTASYFRR